MKKEIECIYTNPQYIKQIIKVLDNDITDKDNFNNELKNGFENLLNKNTSNLIISLLDNDVNEKEIINKTLLQCGKLKINIDEHKVTKNNIEVLLTPKEFDILYFLCKNKGIVFTKEQIYKAIWKDDYLLDDGTIMSFIRKLRKKIEDNPDSPEYIITIWGIGYKFNERI